MDDFVFLFEERTRERRTGRNKNSTNLAGALEEHLLRSLSEIDLTLVIVRTLYERDKNKFDLAGWLKSNRVLNDEDLRVSIVDNNGNVRLAATGRSNEMEMELRAIAILLICQSTS